MKPATLNGYSTLLGQIRSEIESGRKKIETTRAISYWKVGEIIHKDILKHKARADYGQQLFAKLAADLSVSERTIERAVKFHREFPIPTPASKLNWAHYIELLNVSNKFQRKELQRRALAQGLSKNDLRRQIALLRGTRDERRETKDNGNISSIVPRPSSLGTPALKPQKGILYTYKIDKVEDGYVYIDLGFNITHRTAKGRQKLTAGNIIMSNRTDSLTAVRYTLTPEHADSRYFYKAIVERVIDGAIFYNYFTIFQGDSHVKSKDLYQSDLGGRRLPDFWPGSGRSRVQSSPVCLSCQPAGGGQGKGRPGEPASGISVF
jgi:hypothetical protein